MAKPLTPEQRESARQARRRWAAKNRAKLREYGRAYREKNADRKAEWQRRWRQKNMPHVLAYQREYRASFGPAKLDGPTQIASQESRAKALTADAVYAAADRAISRNLPPHLRDDIVSCMVLAALEGQIAIENMAKRAASFISGWFGDQHWRDNVSIDDTIPGRGRQTYAEAIASDGRLL